ncbi:hypothetical protein Leryth_003066 [Lithospermum erythrorhizon]|nr:hypothetical protein Leryth_003066 [Lithospermum erythrorhizon]
MGGCIGRVNKLAVISTLDEPVKGNRQLGRTYSSIRLSDTTTCEVETGEVQSQLSIQSLSKLMEVSDSHGTGSSNNTSEFINHGLILWNQTRQQWVGSGKPKKHTGLREPRISWRATYDSLLGTNKTFRKPIPLGEMIDFLVDVWEQEGMYD